MARLAFRKRITKAISRIASIKRATVAAAAARNFRQIVSNGRVPKISSAGAQGRPKIFSRPLRRPKNVFIKPPPPARKILNEPVVRVKTPTEVRKTQIRNLSTFPKALSLLSEKKSTSTRLANAKTGTINFTKNLFFLFGILGLIFLFKKK